MTKIINEKYAKKPYIIFIQNLIGICILAFGIYGYAGLVPDAQERELLIEADGHFSRCEYDSTVRTWLKLIGKNPGLPESQVCLRSIYFLKEEITGYNGMTDFFEDLLYVARDYKLDPWMDYHVRCILLELYYRTGNIDGVESVAKAGGFVTDWRITGGYSKYGKYDFYVPFLPEEDGNFSGWFPAVYKFRDGAVDTFRIANGVAPYPVNYAYSEISMERGGRNALFMETKDSVRVWVNGKLYMERDLMKGTPSSILTAVVDFREGKNTVLVKTVAGRGGGGFRLFLSGRTDARTNPAEDYLTGRIAESPSDTNALYNLGMLYFLDDNFDSSQECFTKLLKISPENPLFRYSKGITHLFEYPQKRNLAKAEFRTIEKTDTHFLPMYEEIGFSYEEEGFFDKAIDYYREILKKNQSYAYAHFMIGNIYGRKKYWEKEGYDEAGKALEMNPEIIEAMDYMTEYYRGKMNILEQKNYLNRILEIDKSNLNAMYLLSQIYRNEGNYEVELLMYKKILDIDPFYGSGKIHLNMAKSYEKTGDAESSVRTLEEGMKLFPSDYMLPYEAGMLCKNAGFNDKAHDMFEKSLAKKRDNVSLTRYMEKFYGRKNWIKDFEIDAFDYIDSHGGGQFYADASSVMLLDKSVVAVNSDGSYYEQIHQLIMVIDKKGREKWEKVRISRKSSYEIEEIRVIKKDRTTYDAKFVEKAGWTLVDIEDGDIIEYKYGFNRETGINAGFSWGPEYFQRDDEPVVKKLLVLVLPEDMEIDYRISDTREIECRDYGRDGKRVLEFERNGIPAMEEEELVPPYKDIHPFVAVTTQKQWHETYFGLIDDYLGSNSFNSDMTETARILTKGIGSTKDAHDTEEKLEAIYYYVMREINEGSENNARMVYYNKSANEQGRINLFVSLAGAIGIPCRVVFISPKSSGRWDTGFPFQFVFYQPLVESAGRYIDFSNRYRKFGSINMLYEGALGIVRDRDETVAFVRTPDGRFIDNGRSFSAEFAVTETGTLKGKCKLSFFGSYADGLRVYLEDPLEKGKFLDRYFSNFLAGTVSSDAVFSDSDTGSPIEVVFNLECPNFAVMNEGRMIFKPVLEMVELKSRYINKASRAFPLVDYWSQIVEDTIVFKIPEGLSVERLPETKVFDTEYFFYKMEYSVKENTVTARRIFYNEPVYVPVDKYDYFSGLCDDLDHYENMKAVLK